jgi:hypothetical protein
MQGYSKASFGPFMLVYYYGQREASMKGYSKGCLGPFMLVYYIRLLEASMKAIVRGVWCPSCWSIILAK